MTKAKNSFNSIYRKYCKRIDSLISSDKNAAEFYNLLKKSSESEFSAIARQEIKVFDEKWINSIVSWLGAIDRIVKDPKKHIKTVGVLTPVELTRKTDSESIIHLASHSQYVKNINEKGDVIPDKLLNIESEDDFAIYENRFIKTLINKLLVFVERRYDYISKHVDTRDTDIVAVKNKFAIGEIVYEYESKIKISIPSQDEGKKEYNQELLNKIVDIRRMIKFYAESDLMKQLKDAKPVFAPIQQTNIIRKNKDYNACYQLFKFLDTYDKFGVSIRVKEAKKELGIGMVEKLYQRIMFADLSLDSEKMYMADLKNVRARVIKPRINRYKIVDPALSDAKFGYAVTSGPTPGDIARERERLKILKEKAEKQQKRKLEIQRAKLRQAKENEEKKALLLVKKEKEAQKMRKAKELARLKQAEVARRDKERREKEARNEKEKLIIIEARRKVAEQARREKEAKKQKEQARLDREKTRESKGPTKALTTVDRHDEKHGQTSDTKAREKEKALREKKEKQQQEREKERAKKSREAEAVQIRKRTEGADRQALKKALDEHRRERLALRSAEKAAAAQKEEARLSALRKEEAEKRKKDEEEVRKRQEATRIQEEQKRLQYLNDIDLEKVKKMRRARVVKDRIKNKVVDDKVEGVKSPTVKKTVNSGSGNVGIGE